MNGVTPIGMTVWPVVASLPDDVDFLKAMLVAAEAEREQLRVPAADRKANRRFSTWRATG